MTYLSDEVRASLEAAQAKQQKRRSRLRVEAGDAYFSVLRMWENGFALDSADASGVRGLVDVYDGPRHLYQALIVASSEEGGERHFEFKRNTAANDRAPLDFARDENAPIALLQSPDPA
ncbi:MAG: hypothetical protein AAF841_09080 [Pseudomonadota bacterium]